MAAAALDRARVGAGHAAHKTELGNDRAAVGGCAAVGADEAGFDHARFGVAAHKAAHMAGAVQLGFDVLAGLDVAFAQNVQGDGLYIAVLHLAVVDAGHAAEGIAHLGRACGGGGACLDSLAQLPRRKDAVFQGAVVVARNAAQGAIFFEISGHVQRDLYIIYNSVLIVLTCRAAQGDVRRSQAKGQRIAFHLAAVGVVFPADGAQVHARNTAHHRGAALQCDAGVERNALDDAALAVDGCHGAQVGRAALDGATLHRAAGDRLVVDSRDAARLAVFAGDPGACGGILNGAVVFTRDAARKVRCGVDGALIAAALYRAFVLARRAARILARCAHRQGIFGFGAVDFGILGVMARQAARVVGRLYTAADGSGLQRARADVFARKAARIVACGGDGGVQGSDSFDRAVVCAHGTADLGHAAHGGAAVQPADRARVDARHAADILSAVDGCILGQTVLDAARVDARNAADAFILTLHGAQIAVQCAVLYRA